MSDEQHEMFDPPADDPFARRRASRAARKELLLRLPPKGRRPRCAKCNRELSPNIHWDGESEKKFGYVGNNYFCTQSCGFVWALDKLAEDLK